MFWNNLPDNSIRWFLAWKSNVYHWVVILWTPDTEKLAISVRNQIQELLNMRHWIDSEHIRVEVLKKYKTFGSGEMNPDFIGSVRWQHVYVISDVHWDYQPNDGRTLSLNDKWMHDKHLLSAALHHWAASVNFVSLAFPFARQDVPTKGTHEAPLYQEEAQSIAKKTWSWGYVITLDPHTTIPVFKGTNAIFLQVWWAIDKIIKMTSIQPRLAPTDQWWDKKITAITNDLWLQKIYVLKWRDYSQKSKVDRVDVFDLDNSIEWNDILVHDDIIDSWGTLVKVLREILKRKPKSVTVFCSHGIYTKNAIEDLEQVIRESNWIIKKVYTTNSIRRSWLPKFIEQIDATNIVANTILTIYKRLSLNRNDAEDYTLSKGMFLDTTPQLLDWSNIPQDELLQKILSTPELLNLILQTAADSTWNWKDEKEKKKKKKK